MEKVKASWALRFFTDKEREFAANNQTNHSHIFCANQSPHRTRGSVSVPERFWFRSVGTLGEMEAEQKRHNGNGFIRELDWTE